MSVQLRDLRWATRERGEMRRFRPFVWFPAIGGTRPKAVVPSDQPPSIRELVLVVLQSVAARYLGVLREFTTGSTFDTTDCICALKMASAKIGYFRMTRRASSEK